MIPSLWNSTPIGRSIYLRLCPHEQLSPELILEDKILHSVIRLQNSFTYRSQIQFIGTLIVDDQSQRLIYVIDRLQLIDSTRNEISNHSLLSGEFLIPIQCDDKNLSTIKNFIQNGIQVIHNYCHSTLPIELHQFAYLYGQLSISLSSAINADLSFDLLTIKNSFILTPINPEYVNILSTTLSKNLNLSTGNSVYINQPHFGYCTLDQISKNKILFIPENDPQISVLPLVGIWVSGVVNIQSPFVWAACLRYCLNSSLKQRLRTGINPEQSFALACYLSTSPGQCYFYEVSLITNNPTSSLSIDYDLWTCSKKISIPNLSSHQYAANSQFPYDFEFKYVYDGPKMYTLLEVYPENSSCPVQSTMRTRFPTEISSEDNDYNQRLPIIFSSPNTNGSLFGVPRLPPKQSTHQSPSWDSISTKTMATPKRVASGLTGVSPSIGLPQSVQFSSPVPSPVIADAQWKEEWIERMQSYETNIQSLTALITQLLTAQKQEQNFISTPSKESIKRDVAVQSEPLSPCMSDHIDESASMTRNHPHTPSSSKIEQIPFITTTNRSASTQVQLPPPYSVVHQQEPVIDNSSLRSSTDCERLPLRSISSPPPLAPTDLKPVDILKPFFQFMANQQQRQLQRSTSPLMKTNNEDSDRSTENMSHIQQQQHVTSTRTTGISLISNGLQMQFINQQSSTTTVYPPPQAPPPPPPPPPSNELILTSPQKSENNLSIEVHGLEMKYLEDDQLAVAIECDRQSAMPLNKLQQSPRTFNKNMSFGTHEYFEKYGIFTDSNRP